MRDLLMTNESCVTNTTSRDWVSDELLTTKPTAAIPTIATTAVIILFLG